MSHPRVVEWLTAIYRKKKSAKPVAILLKYTALPCGCRRPLRSELGVDETGSVPVWYAVREGDRIIHRNCGETIFVLSETTIEFVQPLVQPREHDGDAA